MADVNEAKRRSIALIFVGSDMENEVKRAKKLEYARVAADNKKIDVVKELEGVSKEEFLNELHEFLQLPPTKKHLFYIGQQDGFSCSDELISSSVVLATVLTSEELIQEQNEESDDEDVEKIPPKPKTRILRFHIFNKFCKDWYNSHTEYMKLQSTYGGPAVLADFISDKKTLGLNTSATAI